MAIFHALSEELSALEELGTAQQKPYLDAELPQVLLLHGYLLGKRSLQGLAVQLQNIYEVARVDYPSLQDLEKTTLQLVEEVKAITDLRGEAISLVGHSMGGLLAVRVAQEYSSAVKKVIALGTPFHGTYGAYTQYSLKLISSAFHASHASSTSHTLSTPSISSIQQMTPKSKFLGDLHERGFPESVRFVSLYSSDDLIVIPWRSSALPQQKNIQNIQISGVGHLGLLGKRCYRIVERALSDLEK